MNIFVLFGYNFRLFDIFLLGRSQILLNNQGGFYEEDLRIVKRFMFFVKVLEMSYLVE